MPPKKRPSESSNRGRPARNATDASGSVSEDEADDASARRPTKRAKTEAESAPAPTTAAVAHRTSSAFRSERGPSAAPTPPREYQSFIMKLFDRSLDLAKYASDSPLYPICRAWLVNQPRSQKLINFKTRILPKRNKREEHGSMLADLKTSPDMRLYGLPAVRLSAKAKRVPKPLPIDKSIRDFDLNYDTDAVDGLTSRDDLLAELKARSSRVRRKWLEHTDAYKKQNFGRSLTVLDMIYKH